MTEAIFMAENAASGWVLTALEDGTRALSTSKSTDIATDQGQFVKMIALDMDLIIGAQISGRFFCSVENGATISSSCVLNLLNNYIQLLQLTKG